MKDCVYCRGLLDPTTLRCQICGREQPTPSSAGYLPTPERAEVLTKPCPSCGSPLPSQSIPNASAVSAGSQTATPRLIATSAAPQTGVPSVSSVPAGTQSGAPSVPSAPGSPQTSTPPTPSTAQLQPVAQGASRSLAAKLLSTMTGKVIAGILAVIVIGAAATGAYIVLQPKPQPVIQVKSAYHVGTFPAGAAGTTITITGQQFSAHSSVTFLLDGRLLPGNRQAQSAGDGTVKASLAITATWTIGRHTLTARDAKGFATQKGVALEIAAPGTAHTPGPSGAPPDDASFTIMTDFDTEISSFFNNPPVLILFITGHPDPMGGTVCAPQDDGQPHTTSHLEGQSNIKTIFTAVSTCRGTYKNGHLTYTEQVLRLESRTDTGNGTTCFKSWSPYTVSYEGNFTSATSISGTVAHGSGTITFTFIPDYCFGDTTFPSFTTTWTGTITSKP